MEEAINKKYFLRILIVSILMSGLVGFITGGIGAKYFLGENVGVVGNDGNEELSYIPPDQSQEEKVIEVVREASPVVVSIILTAEVPVFEKYWENPFEDFPGFSPFDFPIPQYRQKGTEKKQIGGGTGFIISSDGLILTNRHVVEETNIEYTVFTNDGKKYEAEVLARDPLQDLAVLKIEKSNLPVLKLADSDKLQTGQTVVAIGNALGEFKNTVSVGVISGLYRTVTAYSESGRSETLQELIQTDAAINKGNSGGPLLNLKGEVIGINVAMASGAENIGFAIPINKAKKDIQQVKEKGKISYPFLGIRYVLINKEIQERINLTVDYGALIIRSEGQSEPAVVPGSAADEAGLKENDIILEFQGEKITQENSLAKVILKYSPSDEVTLKILREGEEMEVRVVLGEWE